MSRVIAQPILLPPPEDRPLRRFAKQRPALGAYAPDLPLSLNEASQLLWAAQGLASHGTQSPFLTDASHPTEAHLCAGMVQDLPPGCYRYDPDRHALLMACAGDRRRELSFLSPDPAWVTDAPAVIILSTFIDWKNDMRRKHGQAHIDAELGGVAQNLLMMANAMNLNGGIIDTFDTTVVRSLLGMRPPEAPFAILTAGHGVETMVAPVKGLAQTA